MEYEKMKINKDFPIKISFHFSLSGWYLFPQGFTSRGTVEKKRYDDNKSTAGETVYACDAYWLINTYHFKWLFLTILFKSNLPHAGGTYYRIEKDYRPDLKQKEVIGITKSQFN